MFHNSNNTEDVMSELSNLPVELTDHELDQVAAGQLPFLNVVLFDLVDIGDVNVEVAIPINAALAIAVLGNATATAAQVVSITQ
jgi:hypothetical protein